jgi:uncharacterized protein DUF4157
MRAFAHQSGGADPRSYPALARSRPTPRGVLGSAPMAIYEREADHFAEWARSRNHPGQDGRPAYPRLTPTASGEAMAIPSVVQNLFRSAGQSLDPATRSLMGPHLGHDFGNVRVHADAAAADANRALAARAFTSGHHIAFGAGEYRPGTVAGRALIAHELAHVLQQHDRTPIVQRQPKEPPEKSKFDFMLADVEGHLEVVSVLRPTDPTQFLQAFEEKGNELIDAEFTWLTNNLIQFVADGVQKLKRNPFAKLDKKAMQDIGRQAYEKVVGALAVKGASRAGSVILKIINIGKKAAGRIRGFGGVIASIGATLVQLLIGPLFDKSDELVRQATNQTAEGARKVVKEIIPQVRVSGAQFSRFMAGLSQYMLQDSNGPQPAVKARGGATSFSVGEGEYKTTIEINMNVPLTEQRLESIMVDLGNVVLGIDNVAPKLETDLSLRDALALQAGVFTGDVATASPAPEPEPAPSKPPAAIPSKPFRLRDTLPGDTKFDVPAGAGVAIRSEARYDTQVDVNVPEGSRPPVYQISLYRVSTSLIHGDRPDTQARQYHVGKSETAEWYNLQGGRYYVVIQKGGSPNFVLEGNLTIEVRKP